MQFSARLRRHSAIHRQWREGGRVGGLIAGVRFDRQPNGDFVADDLMPDEVEALRVLPDVEMEIITNPQPIALLPVMPVLAEDERRPRPGGPGRGRPPRSRTADG